MTDRNRALEEERYADAFLVEWVKDGETWVHAHADEPTAVDQARRMGGTCTPLYRAPKQPNADVVEEATENPDIIVTKSGIPFEDQVEGVRQFKEACFKAADRKAIFTKENIERATSETARLTRELDITNADHIALWLGANLPFPVTGEDFSLAWLACRIIDAHEAALTPEPDTIGYVDDTGGVR